MKLHVPLVLQPWLQRISRADKGLSLLSMLLVMACCVTAQTNTMVQHTTIASTRFYNGQAPDLDGDGDKDFVTVYDGYVPRYYLNNGSGTFGAGVDFVPGANSTVIEVGDLDNDGDADVVSTNGRVYINNNLTFTQLGTLLIKQNAGGTIAAIKIVDINKDGKKDIVWVNSGVSATAYNEIWLNNGTTGNASFVYATGFTNVNAGLARSSLDVADIDNDGDLDIVTGGENLEVMKNNAGVFTSSQVLLMSNQVKFVDWDLDGDIDIFASTTYNGAGSKVVFNNGAGTFATITAIASINGGHTPFLADLNGDGYTDVAMSVWGNNGYIMLNSGCKFIAANYTLSDASQGFVIADFTGDGKPDIMCCGRDVAAVLWRNDLSRLSPVASTVTTPGNALLFNGTNNCVSIKNDASLNLTTNYTIECWIKPTSYKFLAGLVSKYQSSTSYGYTLRMSGTAPYSGISFDGLETPPGIIELNKWNHIAAVKNGNQRTVYVNGVAYNLGTSSVYNVSSNTDSVTIGVDYAVSGRYFEGSIDEVRIWSVARTQSEILANKNTVLSQCDASLNSILRAYYRFDNGVSNSANVGYNALNDLSDSGNTGLLRNYNLNGTTNWTESYAMVVPTIIPGNNIDVTSTGFTARWTAPTFGTVDGYKLYVSTSSEFTSYISGYDGLFVTGTSYAVTGLQSNTRYYYKVAAEKTSVTGQGAYSNPTWALTLLSANANLSALSLNSGTLSPVFVATSTSYTASVASNINSITVTPTVEDASATVKVNGTTVTSGSASGAITLAAGSNTITVVVTAPDGTTTKTYTINVNKLPANVVYYQTFTNGTLSGGNYNGTPDQLATNLTVGSIQWSGATANNYCGSNPSLDVSVPNIGSTRTMTLTLQVASGYKLNISGISFREASAINNGSFSVTVNGTGYYGNGGVQNACPGITASGSTAMQVSGTVTIAFAATNSGSGAATFSIDDVLITGTIVSTNANLTNLAISSGMLSPVFAATSTSYTASVASNVNSITVTPTVEDASATVKVNGTTVTSGSASGAITLAAGSNTITVVVTAPDGTTTKTYTINVNKLPANVVYYQTFTNGTLSGGNYNGTPDQLATNLTVGSIQWSGATANNYCGSNPSLDVSVPNIGSTRTMTLTLQVASGYKLNISGISFREASAINNGSFSVTVNGTGYYGNGGVQNACPGITASASTAMQVSGTVTIAFAATNSGSGTATFSIDDVLITGSFESTLGNALNLDGVNDYVKINDDNKLDLTNNFTLECWIKPEAFNAFGGILSKYQGNGTAGYTLRLAGSAPYSGINFDNYETAKGILETGKWYHVAAVNNAGVRTLYINGKAQTLTPGGVYTVVANTDSLVMGMDFQSRFFKGSIDEVKIYNTALTSEQVQQDMFSLTAAVPANLVAYYSFNEGVAGADNSTATTLTDYSANALHGTLKRFALNGNSSNWVASTVWNKWTGATNAQYATATNWDLGVVPTSSDNILIPAAVANLPLITSTAQGFHNAQLPAGVAITNTNTLTIKGNVLGAGSINSINGSVVFNGTMPQSIDRGLFTDSTLTGLTYNNRKGVTLTAPLQVTGVVIPTAGTLVSNGNLVLISNASGTARVASHGAGTSITGNVTVQRYIPGGRRVFRFLSHPFTASLPVSSLTDDIDITGTGGSPLTTTVTNNPSAFGYDNVNGNSSLVADPGWFGLTAASTFDANKAYRILVRGSKGQAGSLNGGTYTPDAVTLDWSGVLNRNDQQVTLTNNGSNKAYTLIGNPYASPVDLSLLNRGTNINANFSVWDANVGARGAYVTQPFATAYILPSGAAFFTQSAANTDNAITFTEASKSSGTPAALLRNTGNKADAFTVRINDANGNYADQWSLFHGEQYTANNDLLWDAAKLTNPDLNFYSFSKEGNKLAIDRRPATTDTIHLGFTATTGVYQLIVNTIPDDAITYYLLDTYLGTTTLLTKSMMIPVTVDGNVASTGNNRFKLVTQKAKVIEVNNELLVTASPNPVTEVVNIAYKGFDNNIITVANVINAEGKTLAAFNLGNVQAGKLPVNMQRYARGVYTIQFINGNVVKSIRIIKQ